MARTMKYLERKAMEAYAEFAENPNCIDCPFGTQETFEPWAKDLVERKKHKDKEYGCNCGVCQYFFKYKVVKNSACPCMNIGHEDAIKMLLNYVKKWRKEGLIK